LTVSDPLWNVHGSFGLGMIFSENRFPLFGIMP